MSLGEVRSNYLETLRPNTAGEGNEAFQKNVFLGKKKGHTEKVS